MILAQIQFLDNLCVRITIAKHSAANDTHTVHAAEQWITLALSEIMWVKKLYKTRK